MSKHFDVVNCATSLIKQLKELQNFNGLMAVAGGLTNTALSRLRQTQELLTQECQEVLRFPNPVKLIQAVYD